MTNLKLTKVKKSLLLVTFKVKDGDALMCMVEFILSMGWFYTSMRGLCIRGSK